MQRYQDSWFLLTTALDLSAGQVLEAFAARFRQEDAFRDHKQRLGMLVFLTQEITSCL